ncbi:MAG: thioredoxin family protein [Flavobacteriaceae bacterium]|nr:thioredoxin family protein [Flavobacteriaceae bacterium]|tara:strand:- start:373752 stop:374345 length:594 start_codon:yes stop_codon:yes gene_type:complete
MKALIEKSLADGISYQAYRELVSKLLSEGKSTGPNQTEALTHYSMLNNKRMDRLDKKITISESTKTALSKLNQKQTWLVLTEGWCGDAAQNLPIIHKMAEASNQIDLKLVLRDEHLELMDMFLTNGGRAIPKLIALDENLEVLFTWGARPSIATKMVADYKAAHGKLDDAFKKDLQVWYNKNKGLNLQEDFVKLLNP